MSQVLHQFGINLRYMGVVQQASRSENSRWALWAEMTTRTVKHYFREALRNNPSTLTINLPEEVQQFIRSPDTASAVVSQRYCQGVPPAAKWPERWEKWFQRRFKLVTGATIRPDGSVDRVAPLVHRLPLGPSGASVPLTPRRWRTLSETALNRWGSSGGFKIGETPAARETASVWLRLAQRATLAEVRLLADRAFTAAKHAVIGGAASAQWLYAAAFQLRTVTVPELDAGLTTIIPWMTSALNRFAAENTTESSLVEALSNGVVELQHEGERVAALQWATAILQAVRGANDTLGVIRVLQRVKARESRRGGIRAAMRTAIQSAWPSGAVGFVRWSELIRVESDNDKARNGTDLSQSRVLYDRWIARVTAFLSQHGIDVTSLRAVGFSSQWLLRQNPELSDLARRCFATALTIDPSNVYTLILHAESLFDSGSENAELMRQGVESLQKCLEQDLAPYQFLVHRIYHNLFNAILSPWYFQSEPRSVGELVSLVDSLNSLSSPGFFNSHMYITIGHSYHTLARLDPTNRVSYLLQQCKVNERAHKILVEEEKINLHLNRAFQGDIRNYSMLRDQTRRPCCSRITRSELLELWGYVYEQLFDATSNDPSSEPSRWLLSAIGKYQEGIVYDPTNASIHYKVGCGYAVWLKMKVESKDVTNLTKNPWLENAEKSWTRSLQLNPYHADVYKQWAELYTYLAAHAKGADVAKFQALAKEKSDLCARLEMANLSMMYNYSFPEGTNNNTEKE